MSFFQHKKHWLHVFVALLLCTIAILWAMPKSTVFNYEYEQGRPWRYPSLIASFEFPIAQSEAQLKAQRDSALKDFAPYFYFDTAVETEQLQRFEQDCAEGIFPNLTPNHLHYATQKLREVYARGIISSEAFNQLQERQNNQLRIIENGTANYRKLSEVYSPRSAYEYIMNTDASQREWLSQMDLHRYLTDNLAYDSLKTANSMQAVIDNIPNNIGMVLAGERIIDAGELVSEHQKNILDSMRAELEKSRSAQKDENMRAFLGKAGLVLCSLFVFTAFLALYRPRLFRNPRAVYMLFALAGTFAVFASWLQSYQLLSIYILPFAVVPIIIRIFLDSRTAFFAHLLTLFLASFSLQSNAQFLIIQILAGQTTLYIVKELTNRAQLLRTSIYITLFTWLLGLFFDLESGANFEKINKVWYLYVAINGVLLLFTYPLLYIIEQIFGFTSNVTLIELNNINHPLLRLLSKEAHGTFVHSMEVANIASEVADKIGADVLLVRTAALYHDIGKLKNPAFFTENQGQINPHDQLDEKQSAEIIIGHVRYGISLAEKYRLPRVIRHFISTHHGRSMTMYFYVQAVKKYGEDQVDKNDFTYPGPNPSTREEAILMMADSVEAASRSLAEPTEENIQQLVNKIVDRQVAEGYFANCHITFQDLSTAKRVMTESVRTLRHTRIAYPSLNTEKNSSNKSGNRFANLWKRN